MRNWWLAPTVALCACQWIAGTDDPLPRAGTAPVDAGLDATVDPSVPDGGADATSNAPVRPDSGVPLIDEVTLDRPAALYRFLGVVGGLCFDSSGNGHDVTLGCEYQYPRDPIPVKSTDPAIGLSASPPIECTFPLATVLDFTSGDFAYEIWMRGVSDGTLLSSTGGDPGSPGVEVTINSSGENVTVSYVRRGSSVLASAATALLSEPRHVVISSVAGVPTLWVNGTKGSSMPVKQESLAKAAIRIGDAEGEYGPIVVYDHALSEDRVVAHWKAGSGN